MSSIITVLVAYNQILLSQIQQLLLFIVKNIPLKSPKHDTTSPKYNKLTVDKLPVIKQPEQLDYKVLLTEYKTSHGKNLKPVKSRGSNPVTVGTVCHRCDAPTTTSMTTLVAEVSTCAKFAASGSTGTRQTLK